MMSLAVLYSRALSGMDAAQVTVEVHLANGLPSFTIVGLPEVEVKESKDRVRAALLTCQFEFPAKRITVNLAPADLPKESGRFDLPIALGILAASGQIPSARLAEYEFAGELALTGELRPIRGALAMTYHAANCGRSFVLPEANAAEAALVEQAAVYPAQSLLQVAAHLAGRDAMGRFIPGTQPVQPHYSDMSEVKGQTQSKRALEVAAAGGHSVLMSGPPGTGKSMLAARFPGILPQMSEGEALESAAMQSLGGMFDVGKWKQRPYRAPHHTASAVSLVGGGSNPRPGEISVAMHGVLFLDELPEFERHVLEVLREPLESGRITISRAARRADFRAQFQLIAAMNPCESVALLPYVPIRLKALRRKPFDFKPQTLGEKIKKRRLELGLSQKEVGETLGVTSFTVLNWEKGKTEIPISSMPAILDFLGYDPFPEPKSIAEHMIAKRRARGWSIKEAAQNFGVNEGTWGAWERGGIIMLREHRVAIAAFLDLSEEGVMREMGARWNEAHSALSS